LPSRPITLLFVLILRPLRPTLFPYMTLFRSFRSWKRLACATEDDLQVFLQPLGLWRRRAATLHNLASEMDRRRGRFPRTRDELEDRKSTRLKSSHVKISYAVFCLKKKNMHNI